MQEITRFINEISKTSITLDVAPEIYAKVHMGIAHTHPFWDGNGRIARPIANIPLLHSGLPPIVISNDSRREYIETLAKYQRKVGLINANTGVWPQISLLAEFTEFTTASYNATKLLVEQAKKQQSKREQGI